MEYVPDLRMHPVQELRHGDPERRLFRLQEAIGPVHLQTRVEGAAEVRQAMTKRPSMGWHSYRA